ncbi:MAG: protein-disulfide reductase DsbD domain-containing protein [Candidatus Acidiferrum sp.]
MKLITVSFLFLALASLACSPTAHSQDVSGKDVLAPTAYLSYDPVARGMAFQVAVVLKIRPGFHINAHEVSADYLIPTEIRPEVPAGFKLSDVIYPKGTLESFTFSKDKKLNVYTDTVTVRLPLTVLPSAPLGAQHLAMKVRYQACSTEICLPPVTKDVEATINVVAAQSGAKAANAAVFAK